MKINIYFRLKRVFRTSTLVSFLCLSTILPVTSVAKDADKFVVIIDAGHGGNDTGALDNGVKEKDINLGVALKLGDMIKRKLKSAKVVYTRHDDTFVSLQGRADIANKEKGDLFISIHTNSVDKNNKNRSSVAGSSVYALGLHKDENNLAVARRENSVIELEDNYKQKYSGFDPSKDESYILFEMAQKKNLNKSLRFAGDVQKQLVQHAGRRDRGVHQAGFWVLWATSMPAVLVELDFICNPEAAKFISSKDGQEKMATAIFNAVKNYEASYHSIGGNRAMIEAKEAEANKAVIEAEKKANEELANATSGNNVANDADLLSVESRQASASYMNEADAIEPEFPSEGLALLPAARRNSESRVTSTYENNKARKAAPTKRRRRNEASRNISDSRELESIITLHSETERYAIIEQPEKIVEESPINNEDFNTKNVKQQKKNKKEKKNRKSGGKSNMTIAAKTTKTNELSRPARRTDKNNMASHKARRQTLKTLYKIQILASEDKLKQGDDSFQGLKPISAIHENNIYKYTYGESEDKSEMEALLVQIKDKFPDAVIIKCLN